MHKDSFKNTPKFSYNSSHVDSNFRSRLSVKSHGSITQNEAFMRRESAVVYSQILLLFLPSFVDTFHAELIFLHCYASRLSIRLQRLHSKYQESEWLAPSSYINVCLYERMFISSDNHAFTVWFVYFISNV